MRITTIEELLTWAFVDELSKGGGVNGLDNSNSAWRQIDCSSWGLVSDFAEHMAVIDRDRSAPGMWIEQGAPHEDALEVGQAVRELANLEVVFPEGWSPIADWPETYGLGDEAVRNAVDRFMLRSPQARQAHIVGLIISTAVLNRIPDFEAPMPETQVVTRMGRPCWFVQRTIQGSLGQCYVIEADGYNPRTKAPQRGAYRKYEFTIDPAADIMGRIDYQIWVAALKYLETALMPRLIDSRLRHTDRSFTPWLDDYDGLGLILQPASNIARRKKFASAC